MRGAEDPVHMDYVRLLHATEFAAQSVVFHPGVHGVHVKGVVEMEDRQGH